MRERGKNVDEGVYGWWAARERVHECEGVVACVVDFYSSLAVAVAVTVTVKVVVSISIIPPES
jgi:hypothetical protein